MSNDYTIEFDLSSYKDLDKFALLACQEYNYSNKDNWFNLFRKGFSGMYARLFGVKLHYNEIHSWERGNFQIQGTRITEYHLSSLLFNMDSSIECMVYAINALGYIVDSGKFIEITDTKKLKKISPNNIIGKSPYSGYKQFFPSFTEIWEGKKDLIKIITTQHDVSKHRSAIFIGGKKRNDPPNGFFNRLGINDDEVRQILVAPYEEILLLPNPKLVFKDQTQVSYKDMIKLEAVSIGFSSFINQCGKALILDAKNSIKLNVDKLKTK